MKNKIAAIVAVVSAAFASICCVGPLLLSGLGLGSLGLAAGLTRYRPLFLALSGIALAFGFYRVYRKRPVSCEDGSCQALSGSRRMKAALWIVTALAAAVASFPNWSGVLARRSAAVPAGARTMTLKVSDMDCAACTLEIKKSVEKVPGVYSVSVDFDSQQATVVTDGKADPQAVLQAVSTAGYKAEIISGETHGKPRA